MNFKAWITKPLNFYLVAGSLIGLALLNVWLIDNVTYLVTQAYRAVHP